MTERPLLECIPNFSEGRNEQVVAQIASAIESVAGLAILHQTSDSDHHRSVITFAGKPESVLEASFRMIEMAARLIDLDHHQGVHPRLGATDVVPFVPLKGITLAESAELAHRLGERVGRELGLPVYLYEAAATRPERRNLADVRRGGYEQLKDEIHLPERQPDYGAAQVGKAGAVIIGARQALIAFNVFLNSEDVRIAQAIARAIRGSSGGLVGLKALGLLVDGRAQVSMNVVDYPRTPLHRIFELIRREAAYFGVGIHHSELIGLIPQAALLETAAWYLQLHEFDDQRVLENRLLSVADKFE